MEVKSFGTFPMILVKLATPPLPPQTKLNFEQNAESFAGAGCGGGGGFGGAVGGRREDPKRMQKLLLGAEFYETIP